VMANNSITSYGFEKIGEDSSVTLNASTHNGEYATRQPMGGEVEDMSYVGFKGNYGLNDWVVFDFTGDNMPFVSFFNSEVTNTIYNQEYTAEQFTNKAYTGVSGWVIGNGIRTPNGSILGGVDYSAQNRLTLIGPNKITALYDGNTIQNVANVQTRSVISDFALSIKALQDSTASYRIFMGFVEGADSSKMNLVVHAIDVATGAVVVSDQSLSVAKCSVEGSIALHGQFGKTTKPDKIYPIMEDMTLDAVKQALPAEIELHNGTLTDGRLVLNASTHKGSADNIPLNDGYQEDMSYIALNGKYGLNDYLVFDFTGDNIPFISFFNNTVTNTMWNWAQDTSLSGWVIANGIKSPSGKNFNGGGQTTEACRLMFYGPNKMTSYDGNAGQWRELIAGSKAEPSPISTYVLSSQEHYEGYRAIIGVADAGNGNVTLQIYVVNRVSGEVVADYAKTYNATVKTYSEGSIVLYGQFDHATEVERLYPVEEDTTLENLIEKYQSKIVHNATIYEDGSVQFEASTHKGSADNIPQNSGYQEDMSYIALNGKY
ncbi:MAG: hypothetical protein J6K86_03095, partial [Clostridia bacterium]|nr:hypothetical protein [Clostridia bacterium]